MKNIVCHSHKALEITTLKNNVQKKPNRANEVKNDIEHSTD